MVCIKKKYKYSLVVRSCANNHNHMETDTVINKVPLSFSDKVYKGAIPRFSIQIRIRVRNIIMRKPNSTFPNPSNLFFIFLVCCAYIKLLSFTGQNSMFYLTCSNSYFFLSYIRAPLQGTIFQIPSIDLIYKGKLVAISQLIN